jgi:GcrA cell cycle regulator
LFQLGARRCGWGRALVNELLTIALQHCRIFRTAHFSRHPPSKAINMSANCATWTSERIELLKRCLHAGLSCGQIAREIGVTRNAVIGKRNRLGLSRPKDVIGRQLEQRRAARLARPKTPRTWRPKRPRLNIFAQHQMLFPRPQPRAEDIPIYNGRGCTLLELSQMRCRWPISNPGAEDFCFCGNEPVKGLPYCLGHTRIAYRPVGRQRSTAGA